MEILSKYKVVHIDNKLPDINLAIQSTAELLSANDDFPLEDLCLIVFHAQFAPINRIHDYKKLWKNYDDVSNFKLGDEISFRFPDAALWISCCKGPTFELCEFVATHSLNSMIVHTKTDLLDGQTCYNEFKKVFISEVIQNSITDIYPFTHSSLCDRIVELFNYILLCSDDGEGVCFNLYSKKGNTGDSPLCSRKND